MNIMAVYTLHMAGDKGRHPCLGRIMDTCRQLDGMRRQFALELGLDIFGGHRPVMTVITVIFFPGIEEDPLRPPC
jgi:hypothetical protein